MRSGIVGILGSYRIKFSHILNNACLNLKSYANKEKPAVDADHARCLLAVFIIRAEITVYTESRPLLLLLRFS